MPKVKWLFSRADVERAKAIFVAVFAWLSGYQYERGIRKLLPDNEILGRNGEPTESEHVPAGLCDLPGLGPCNLGNHFPFAFSPSAVTVRINRFLPFAGYQDLLSRL
jgi:hypothetical protein